MTIKLSNTLSGKLEEFKPFEPGKVKMYHCGPTVYDYVHIGNLRSFLLADILRRTLEYLGFEVKQIMNITDVGIGGNNDEGEDKIISGLKREGKKITMDNMKVLGEFYTERFKEDIAALNIKVPHVLPKASEHIEEQIKLIKILEAKGFIYEIKGDGMYFEVEKDPTYPKLTKKVNWDISGTRVLTSHKKRSPLDFAVWKLNSNLGFPSPWGQGFPGWHIECSAMAMKYLGNTFDVHTGGMDLAPVHHNNEIAQSENACNCEFARYWLHNEFVNVPEGKMAKSEGTGIHLSEIVKKGFSPLAYRYFLLMAHYRTPVTFTWEALKSAYDAYRKLKVSLTAIPAGGKVDEEYKEEFVKALENDLNTPQALAVVWKIIDKAQSGNFAGAKTTILNFDKVLGLKLEYNEFLDVPKEILELGEKRQKAKEDKNFDEADKIRGEVESQGYEIRDTEDTYLIFKL